MKEAVSRELAPGQEVLSASCHVWPWTWISVRSLFYRRTSGQDTLLLGAECAWTAESFEVRVACGRPPSGPVSCRLHQRKAQTQNKRDSSRGREGEREERGKKRAMGREGREGREKGERGERGEVSRQDGGSAGVGLLERGRAAAMSFLLLQPY